MGTELIKKQLKSGELASIYLLYGDEDYLKDFYCREVARKAVDGMESFNLHNFNAENFDLSKLEAAIDNLPLLSARKCIVLRDIDPDELREEDWNQFKKLLKAIPGECVLVMNYTAVKYDKKSNRWKTLLGIVQKKGTVAEIGRQPKADLEKWLVKKAAESRCTLTAGNAEHLINTCGEDMNLLTHELEKLCSYTPGGEISREAIEMLATKPLDASIYELARAVTAGRTGYAFKIIDELIHKKEEPVVILSALSGAFCDLYRAKTAMACRAGQSDLEADFKYQGREFRIRNAMRDCSSLDLPFIRANLDLLMRSDENLKSTRADRRFILERLIVEMTALRKRVHA
jgi:DNA polymerase-3 subunit delta